MSWFLTCTYPSISHVGIGIVWFWIHPPEPRSLWALRLHCNRTMLWHFLSRNFTLLWNLPFTLDSRQSATFDSCSTRQIILWSWIPIADQLRCEFCHHHLPSFMKFNDRFFSHLSDGNYVLCNSKEEMDRKR